MAAIALAVLAAVLSGSDARGQSLQAANASFAWVASMGGASGNVPDLSVDTNGNCYAICHFNSTNAIVGSVTLTNSGAGYDTFLVKYNSQGQVQWVRQAFGNANDFGLTVAVDPSGPIYIAGNFYSDVLTIGAYSVTNSTSSGSADIFIAKLDPNGNVLWLRRAGGDAIDTAFHVAVDGSGNLLVTGSFFSTTATFDTVSLTGGGDSDMFLAKYDPSGHIIWARRGGGTKADTGYRMAVDSANNCFVTGYFQGSATFGTSTVVSAGSFDVYLAKYDSSGNVQWVTSGGGSGTDEGFAIALDSSGNAYVAGFFTSASASFGGNTIHTAGGNDIFIVKVSPAGSVLWARSAGGSGSDRGFGLAVDSRGNAYVSGFFSSTATFGSISLPSTGAEDLCVIKYDPNGDVQWVVPASGVSNDTANSIIFDASGHLFLSGFCSTNTVFGNLTLTNALDSAMFVARLDFLLPLLKISHTGSRPILSWATNSAYALVAQTSTNLANAAAWHDVTNLPIFLNGTNSITNLTPISPSFYRLRSTN